TATRPGRCRARPEEASRPRSACRGSGTARSRSPRRPARSPRRARSPRARARARGGARRPRRLAPPPSSPARSRSLPVRDPVVGLDRVAVLERPHHAVLRQVDGVPRGLPDVCGRARNGREHGFLERRRVAARRGEPRHLRGDDVADLERAHALADLVPDRGPTDLHDLADQARQVGQRPAELARVGVEERLHLLVRGPIVNEDHDPPRSRRQHVAGDLDDVHDRQPADVDALHRPGVEEVGDERVARSPIGVLADPARTSHAARAGLEPRSLQVVDDVGRLRPLLGHRHRHHPFRRRRAMRHPGWRCRSSVAVRPHRVRLRPDRAPRGRGSTGPAVRAAPVGGGDRVRARLPDVDGFVERNGVKLGYEVFGDGPKTVLLMPTFPIVNSRMWKAQIPFLARHYRVVTFDGPGNGRSDRPLDPGAYTDDAHVAATLAVLDETGTDSAVFVALCSGVRWTTEVAVTHPDRVRGIVAIAPGIPHLTPPLPWRAAALERFDDVVEESAGWAAYENRHRIKNDYLAFLRKHSEFICVAEPHSTKILDDLEEWGLETDPEILLAFDDAPGGELFPKDLEAAEALCRSVRCPTLVIVGDRDACQPPDRGRRYAELTRGDLVVLEGAGHLPHARHPVVVNRLIKELVDGLVGPNVVRSRTADSRGTRTWRV